MSTSAMERATFNGLKKRVDNLFKVQHYKEALRVAYIIQSTYPGDYDRDQDIQDFHDTLLQHVNSNEPYFVGQRATRSTPLLEFCSGQWQMTLELFIDVFRWCAFFNVPRIRGQAFVYLLIDCQIIGADPTRCSFNDFISSVFYVGKGNGDRPLNHLHDAQRTSINVDPLCSEKIRKIREVISAGEVGILKLSPRQTDRVAFTMEHAMIEAFGEGLLTNVAEGHSYDSATTWNRTTRERLGTVLIFGAHTQLTTYPNTLERYTQREYPLIVN